MRASLRACLSTATNGGESAPGGADRLAGVLVEEQVVRQITPVLVIEERLMVVTAEVEHAVDRVGKGIERAGDALTVQPVVLDKPEDRRLVGYRVIDEVLFRPRR